MEDLQATVEISVDLGYFFNVDMFQRGFYNVAIEPTDPSPVRSNLEVHILKDDQTKCFSPAKISDHGATSKTVHVLHKYQEVSLDHTFLFRCHRLIDSRNILPSISSMKFQLDVKLCFCPADDEAEIERQGFEVVSSRTIMLHLDPIQGLHEFTLVVFDYGYMAGIEMTVHSSLVALHQPLLSTLTACANAGTSSTQTITLESILFRPNQRGTSPQSLANHLKDAATVHSEIINILLSIYSYLKNYLTQLLKQIPKKPRYSFEFSDCLSKLKAMRSSIGSLNNKEEVIDQANMNLASACSYVLALWSHILDIVCLNRHTLKKLSFSYHKQRTQRFQSLFFTVNNPRAIYDEQRMSLYNCIASEVRASGYFQSLPPLRLECVENDGSLDVLPIVFEDKYSVDCKKTPVFKQKENMLVSQQHTALTSIETKKNEKNDSVPSTEHSHKGSPDFKVSHVLPQNSATLTINSKCITDMSDKPTAYMKKFSEEIFSVTMEEPDDYPDFASVIQKKHTTSQMKQSATFSGPGYVSKLQHIETEITNDVYDAFGAGCNLHFSADTLTTQMLSPADEPETKSSIQYESDNNDKETNIPEQKIPLPLKQKPCEIPAEEEAITLEAFLEEGLDFMKLHDAVCEPYDESPQKEKQVEISTNGCNFHNTDTILSKQETRHAAEKSKLLGYLQFPGHIYCDLPFTAPLAPYLVSWKVQLNNYDSFDNDSHLIVLVHGLDGSSSDLRMVKTYLQLGLHSILKMSGKSESQVSFLMSVANERDTYDDLQVMTNKLVDEILRYVKYHYISSQDPKRISFVGHSLGGLLIRSAVTSERLRHLRSRFHTFLSFSTPHLGTVLNSSTLVNTGLWLMQKWKKSACLRQLSCKEVPNLRNTFIYKLSKRRGFEFFNNILLVASADDRYVPYQSARIEMCKAAFKEKVLGPVYQEMIDNIMTPVLENPKLNLLRYHVVHSLPTATANSVIGRAAHIAVLDSDLFLEQFFLVTALQYFM